MHSVPVSPHAMKQVALDLCLLPEADGYRHLIVCVDYFTKWWNNWKEVEISLADSIIRKILLVHHRSYLLEKKSNSNWSFRRSKGVVRNRQLHTYGKRKEDSSQWKLICKALGRLESHQLVLNWQKRGTPFSNISEEHIQLMHNGANHWLISFRSNDRIQICDSLYTSLIPVIKNCLIAF